MRVWTDDFSFVFESVGISEFLESEGKTIPCFRFGILGPYLCFSNGIKSESPATEQIGGCRYHVGRVGRTTADV